MKKEEVKKEVKVEPEVEEAIPEPKEPTMVEKANEAAERLEKANTEKERLLLREEKLQAEKALGGTADAGTKELTEDEKETEGAKKLLAGTGYEEMFDDPSKKEVE